MFKKNLIYTTIFMLMIFPGCGENLTDEVDSAETTFIKGEIEDDLYSLFSLGVVDDEDPQGDVLSKPVLKHNIDDDANLIPKWFRRVQRTSKDVQIHFASGIADVSITTSIEGLFKIDADGDGGFGEKDIRNIAVRHAIFERNLTDNGRRWRLKEISPVEINIQDADKRTISIIEVKASVDGELRWIMDDSAAMYTFPSELSHFVPGETVVVTAMIENLNIDGTERESYVYLHNTTNEHHRGERHHGSRHMMFDDGITEGDEVAGDGIFTGTYTIGEGLGYHHSAIDVLDKEMFDDQTTQNYNAMIWAMPYIVEAAVE